MNVYEITDNDLPFSPRFYVFTKVYTLLSCLLCQSSKYLMTLSSDILLAAQREPLMPWRLGENLHLHISAPFSDIA